MDKSIAVSKELCKCFLNGLASLSSTPQRRMLEMIFAMAQKGHTEKTADYCELACATESPMAIF